MVDVHARLFPAALIASALLVLAGCAGSAPAPASPDSPSASSPASAAAASGACAYRAQGQAARDVTPPPAGETTSGAVTVTLETSAGAVPMTLTGDRTPCTVESFVSLADQGYFTGTDCHRLTTQGIFVLQCGDPSGTGRGGPGYSFTDEVDGSEKYPAGTVAMANAGPDTNGSQFFLVYADSPLPPDYTVFGQLSPEGLDVVKKIGAAGVAGGGADGPPATAVAITGVTVG
ncbi:putative peptidyl-prolyl cis-trans isomerase B [Microbacterium sp. Bi128]|nr:putative peptidyl-prolyl cis-trans isomerase B [Microbacterium sp. Bi128]